MNKKRGMTPEKAEKVMLKRGFNRGTKLRAERVQKGLSQSELSAASGVPIKTLQKYEQGPRYVDSARLDKLCRLSESLGCKITDIIEDKELIDRFNKVK